MATISVCMIVKNEEKILARCLDSLKGIWDELIIVDTGSTDSTKEIAKKYTDKIYDFTWVNDFSKARNFSFSKASCDYIYTADADEILDDENRKKFLQLKSILLPEIDIVQMKYENQLDNGTVYNFDNEYRAKLYKRLRTFTFIDSVHEIVRTDPVVYDSDVEIIHKPQSLHSERDICIFEGVIARDGALSERLMRLYARELLISGNASQFEKAADFFGAYVENTDANSELMKLSYIILAKNALLAKDAGAVMKYALKDVVLGGSSEMCEIVGSFYEQSGDYKEARLWYYNACFETEPEACVIYSNKLPLEGLVRVCKALNDFDAADLYQEKLDELHN